MSKETWLPSNLTALSYKIANYIVISTDWSHLWYSASSCYALRKCVILKCDIQLTVTGLRVGINKQNKYSKLHSSMLVTVTWNRNKFPQNPKLDSFILITCKNLHKL